jgi:bifunctional DNase/RNase
VIGDCEASSIQSYKSGTQSTRPMTYDLFTNILMTEQLKIQKVIITKLENNTYYAVVAINNSGKISYVDSRPSDAINLALRSNATVYVMRKVLEDAGEAR